MLVVTPGLCEEGADSRFGFPFRVDMLKSTVSHIHWFAGNSRTEVSIMAKGNNSQNKETKKPKAAAKAAPAKAAPAKAPPKKK